MKLHSCEQRIGVCGECCPKSSSQCENVTGVPPPPKKNKSECNQIFVSKPNKKKHSIFLYLYMTFQHENGFRNSYEQACKLRYLHVVYCRITHTLGPDSEGLWRRFNIVMYWLTKLSSVWTQRSYETYSRRKNSSGLARISPLQIMSADANVVTLVGNHPGTHGNRGKHSIMAIPYLHTSGAEMRGIFHITACYCTILTKTGLCRHILTKPQYLI